MRLGAAVAAIAAGVTAAAAGWQMPPARYDHEPRMSYSVRYRGAEMLNFYCGSAAMHANVGGCAIIEDGRCWITIRDDLGRADRRAVLRHEKGHCNGWPGSHPRR